MAITYGFFNAVKDETTGKFDRVYDAEAMSNWMFEGMLSNGVCKGVGDELKVTSAGGLTVKVGTGKAIINGKWIKNDEELTLSVHETVGGAIWAVLRSSEREMEIGCIDSSASDVGAYDAVFLAYYSTSNGVITTLEDAREYAEILPDMQDLTDVKADVATLQTDAKGLQEDTTTLQSDVATLQEDTTTLQSDVATLQSDVATLQSDVATLQEDTTTLQSDVATLQSDVATLQSKTGLVYDRTASVGEKWVAAEIGGNGNLAIGPLGLLANNPIPPIVLINTANFSPLNITVNVVAVDNGDNRAWQANFFNNTTDDLTFKYKVIHLTANDLIVK